MKLMHEVKESKAVFAAGEGDGKMVMRFKHIIIIDGLFDFAELRLIVFHERLLKMSFGLFLIIA